MPRPLLATISLALSFFTPRLTPALIEEATWLEIGGRPICQGSTGLLDS